ncbi:MAG: hypothetical protein QGF20_10785, partial [Alphaproteobacteria bacterium]|nr:hypothetical protein [Alphaproteobacteria bacterium]
MSFRFALALAVCMAPALAVQGQTRAEFIGASRIGLDDPHDLKLSRNGKYLFVSDVGNDRIAIL